MCGTNFGGGAKISTHTLTWSVTKPRSPNLFTKYISTHTLTWSVTRDKSTIFMSLSDFNSHAHVERDMNICQLVNFTRISTHTLTWSVTGIEWHILEDMIFQLTRSRGAWLIIYLSLFLHLYFNSHAHVERDFQFDPCCLSILISTHTLTWSVTGS